MKNYKSILGLNTVKAFIVVLLSLSIVAIVTLVILGALASTNLKTGSTSIYNASTSTVVNSSTNYVVSTNYNCNLALTTAMNASGSSCAGNYTISGCNIVATTASGGCNNTVWYITGTYSDSQGSNIITSNVSTGLIAFFGNATTFFALLGVVVIILIISLVVVVVNRFGGENSGQNQDSL